MCYHRERAHGFATALPETTNVAASHGNYRRGLAERRTAKEMLKLGSLQPSFSFVAEDLSLFPALNAVLPSDCFRNICALLTELWTGHFQNVEVQGSGLQQS